MNDYELKKEFVGHIRWSIGLLGEMKEAAEKEQSGNFSFFLSRLLITKTVLDDLYKSIDLNASALFLPVDAVVNDMLNKLPEWNTLKKNMANATNIKNA